MILPLPIMSLGGRGVISVTSNIAPNLVSRMCSAFAAGNLAEARALHFQLMPLNRAMFLETNPIPVKTAYALVYGQTLELRLPLTPLQSANLEKLTSVLRTANVLH